VNKAQSFLRLAGKCRELERILQPELRAEQTQAVKELDGLRVVHNREGGSMSGCEREVVMAGTAASSESMYLFGRPAHGAESPMELCISKGLLM
jgi:hypothetical protein